MISSHIRRHFSQHSISQDYKNISPLEWADWQWQMSNVIEKENDQDIFATPYYLNLRSQSEKSCPIKKLILVQKYLYKLDQNILRLNDQDLLFAINQANFNSEGLTEIYLPFLSVLPQRVSESLLTQLKKRDQVIIHISINHPQECTLELFEACSKLADSGFIINNQMTLLKGINDSKEIVKDLNLKLLMMRVRPYLIYAYENIVGAPGFAIEKEVGVEILDSLRGWTSGLAVPHLLVQSQTNTFKAHLPNYIKKSQGEYFVFRNFKNLEFQYTNSED